MTATGWTRDDTGLGTLPARPGSDGEHALQESLGTAERADTFYANQVRDRLLPRMARFVERNSMLFVATSAAGRCRSSVSCGEPGFVRVLDEHHLAVPEQGGAPAVDDMVENPQVGLLMVDFQVARIGLHVNGRVRVVDEPTAAAERAELADHPASGDDAVWVLVEVDETYVHCRKHIPQMTTLASLY